MTPKPKYSDKERENVYATLIFIAKLLNQAGINTIIDATGNLRKYRALARKELKKFAIAYTKCPLDICIERERRREKTFHAPTEIYDKGRNGRSTTVPGLNVPYEEPLEAEVVVRTDKETVAENTEKLYNFLMTWKN